jgi:hypothetical protein
MHNSLIALSQITRLPPVVANTVSRKKLQFLEPYEHQPGLELLKTIQYKVSLWGFAEHRMNKRCFLLQL